MNQKLADFNRSLLRKKLPTVNVGDIVRIHKKIKEGGKERIQVFKGLVIAIKGGQSSSRNITVRRESQGVGVEMIIPLNLPSIEKIDILRHSKVRRAKLYYMRNRTGKSAKMKIKEMTEAEKNEIEEIFNPKSEVEPEEKTAIEKTEEETK